LTPAAPPPDRGRASGRHRAGAALGARLLAHRGELLRRGVAAIGLAAGEQLLGDLAVARGAAELVDDLAVPIEPSHFSPSRMASIAASVERSRSVSSIRSSILPPRRAHRAS
jgi:hypothetical protein